MATYTATQTVSATAGSAVTIYRFVQLAADSQYDHAGAQERMEGIAAETQATVGATFPMVIPNGAICKVEAGAAVALLATVGSDASGRAITAVSGDGNYTAGIAMQAAGAAGDVIEIQFIRDLDQVT